MNLYRLIWNVLHDDWHRKATYVVCSFFYIAFSFREQQINEQLQKNRKESEDMRDSSASTVKYVEQLKKQLTSIEKDRDALQEKLNQMENEVRLLFFYCVVDLL